MNVDIPCKVVQMHVIDDETIVHLLPTEGNGRISHNFTLPMRVEEEDGLQLGQEVFLNVRSE